MTLTRSDIVSSERSSPCRAPGKEIHSSTVTSWQLPARIDLVRTLVWGGLFSSIFLIITMAATLIINGAPILFDEEANLLSLSWHPQKGEFGILPMLYGTSVISLIAIAIASPLGILSAIAISEYLPRKLHFPIKGFLEILAGIPSIIYGLIGVALLAPYIQDSFDLQSGRTILAGALLLAIMILPTIVTLCEDALTSIPQQYRETATGLGLFKYEVIKDVLLPIARTDFLSAILLALGRALGETMAVMLVIGSIDRIPSPITNILSPAQTITSKIGREISDSAFGSPHFQALIFLALVLVGIGLTLSIFAQLITKKGRRLES